MSLSSHQKLLLAASIPALGLVELGLHLFFAHRAPTEAQWAEARPRVIELRAQAAGAVVAPWWAEPHARQAFGEEVLPLRDVARPDESRYPTLLEISALGEHLPELAGWRVLREERVGPALTARLLENPRPATVRFSLTDAIEAGRAEVRWQVGEQPAPCAFHDDAPVVAPGLFGHPAMPPRRFVCGKQAWQSVGVTVQDDERFRARRCVWAHPPQDGEVQIRFSDVPLAHVLRGHWSIHWTLEREQRGAPIFLDAFVEGEHIGQARHDDGQGWAVFELPLGEHARETGSLELRIHSPDAADRQICFDADLRD